TIVGTIGLLRFPDVYARMHAAGITDTMGAGLIVTGLMLQGGFSQTTVKLALILIFLLFTSPTSTYALANAAYHGGLKPILGRGGAHGTGTAPSSPPEKESEPS
ncbi:MAG: sodium:proton antiporter, partial [Alphaproteobacteria bacterium]